MSDTTEEEVELQMEEDDVTDDDVLRNSERFLRCRMTDVLPVVRYVPAMDAASTCAPEPEDWEDSEFADFPLEDHNSRCYICWEDYQPPRRKSLGTADTSPKAGPELLKQFACGHVFHQRCATHWMRENDKCLLCRRNLCPPEGSQMEEGWSAMYNLSRDREGTVRRTVQLQLLYSFDWERTYYAHFSADSKLIAVGSGRQFLRILEIATLSVIRTLGEDPVSAFAFGPDGKTLATGHTDGRISLWNGDAVKHTVVGHIRTVWALEVTTDGQLLMSASDDNTVWIWDMTNGTAIHNIKIHELGFASIALDGRFVAVGQQGGRIRIWSLETGTVIKRFKAHGNRVTDAVFTPGGDKMLTGSADMTVKMWNTSTILADTAVQGGVNENTQEPERSGGSASQTSFNVTRDSGTFVGHQSPVWALGISCDGRWVVSGDNNGQVHIWDAKTTVVQCILQGHDSAQLIAVRMSPNNELIVTCDDNGRVRIWRFTKLESQYRETSQELVASLHPAPSPIVSPDSQHSRLTHEISVNPEQIDHSSPSTTDPTLHSSSLVSQLAVDVGSPATTEGTVSNSPLESIGSKISTKLRRLLGKASMHRRTSQRRGEC
ncbi:WD40-repeat-containing domain protein [Sparassis latifolia]